MYLLAFLVGLAVGVWLHYRAVKIKVGICTYQLKRALKQADDFNNEAKYTLEKIQYERETGKSAKDKHQKILADREACDRFLATIPD